MATFTVTTLEDTVNANDGKLSLREALAAANATVAEDTITFSGALEGGTLVLVNGSLRIDTVVNINGDPDNDNIGITLEQHSDDQAQEVFVNVFDISSKSEQVNMSNLTISSGTIGINSSAKLLTLEKCVVEGNGSYSNLDNEPVGNGIHADNVVIRNSTIQNNGGYAGAGIEAVSCYIVDSVVLGNSSSSSYGSGGGAGISAEKLHAIRTSVIDNSISTKNGSIGGGISGGYILLESCTIAGNAVSGGGGNFAAGIIAGMVVAVNSTITNNTNYGDYLSAGIYARDVKLINSIVAGNNNRVWNDGFDGYHFEAADVQVYNSLSSNGHNVVGAVWSGASAAVLAEGDTVDADPTKLFFGIDPNTGGGRLVLTNGKWVVPLRDALDNPALSGADPASSTDADQRGAARPQPEVSNPDIGAYELTQTDISTTATTSNDVLTGTSSANTLSAKAGNDLLLGLAGNDILKGEAGGDTLQGGLGDDRLEGGTGIDTASYRDATGPVQANLINGKSGGAAGIDTLISIEGLVGSAFNDSLGGNAGSNAINGLAGNDKLYGDAGDDSLRGGNGDDSLFGGLGNDRLDGGAGKDTANYSDATAAVQANLKNGASQGALGTDKLFSIENLTGGAYKDTLGGDAGANTLQGGGGDDKLYGDAGNDNLQGQDGNDTLFGFTGDDKLDGGAGIDTASYADITGAGVTVSLALTTAQITGGGGKDTLLNFENLIGSALADSLTGSSGANTLTGGLGKDMLKGNAGNDLFDFNTAADSAVGVNADWITDFTGAGATVADRIDLADVYSGTLSFKGTGGFTGVGQVRVLASGSDTIVQVNLSGTTAPEMEIHVQDGAATPGQWVAGDFIL
ncbi:MAG: calcium-binding protein [Geminicoccaceae bacterium]